jgi:hypothetical protein
MLGPLLIDLPKNFRAHPGTALALPLKDEMIQALGMIVLVFRRQADGQFGGYGAAKNRRSIGIVGQSNNGHRNPLLLLGMKCDYRLRTGGKRLEELLAGKTQGQLIYRLMRAEFRKLPLDGFPHPVVQSRLTRFCRHRPRVRRSPLRNWIVPLAKA